MSARKNAHQPDLENLIGDHRAAYQAWRKVNQKAAALHEAWSKAKDADPTIVPISILDDGASCGGYDLSVGFSEVFTGIINYHEKLRHRVSEVNLRKLIESVFPAGCDQLLEAVNRSEGRALDACTAIQDIQSKELKPWRDLSEVSDKLRAPELRIRIALALYEPRSASEAKRRRRYLSRLFPGAGKSTDIGFVEFVVSRSIDEASAQRRGMTTGELAP